MIPFQIILVAADFSESSRKAFCVAYHLARDEKTRIHVVHVVEPTYVTEEPVYSGQQTIAFDPIQREPDFYESLKAQLRKFYLAEQALNVDYETCDEGDVAGSILRRATELGCDLIAMGTHGRTGLDRLLTGSVAETVLRKAHCPVLALRDLRLSREGEPIRVIVHPTDFSERSEPASRWHGGWRAITGRGSSSSTSHRRSPFLMGDRRRRSIVWSTRALWTRSASASRVATSSTRPFRASAAVMPLKKSCDRPESCKAT